MNRALGTDPLRHSLFKKTDGMDETKSPADAASTSAEQSERMVSKMDDASPSSAALPQTPSPQTPSSVSLIEELPDPLLIISFRLGSRIFAFDVRNVQRVIHIIKITKVPQSLPFMEGVIDMMGTIVPVISLRRLFRMPPMELTTNANILIGEMNGRMMGFIVDAVTDMLQIFSSSIDPPGQITPLQEFLLGLVRLQSEIVFLINFDRVMNLEQEFGNLKEIDLTDEFDETELDDESDSPSEISERGLVQKVLLKRAIALSQKNEQKESETRQLLIFSLGTEWYGIDTASVRTIIRPPRIVSVPCAPEYINGVINLRGEILTVTNLKKIFGLDDSIQTPRSRVIVVEHATSHLGLIVDLVHDVIDIPTKHIKKPLSTIEKVRSDYIEGEVHLDGRLFGILRLSAVMTPEQAWKA